MTLARYANAAFGACRACLEDPSLPPAALPALLGLVQQAARHQHSLKWVWGVGCGVSLLI